MFHVIFGIAGRYESLLSDKASVSSKQEVFDSLSAEIENMIAKLTQVDDQVGIAFSSSHVEKLRFILSLNLSNLYSLAVLRMDLSLSILVVDQLQSYR